jgi:DNA-binding NarL/FixJ family response regulator
MIKPTVIIVDDHDITLFGLNNYIKQTGKLDIIGLARNGHEALELIKIQKPDIVFTDVDMPEMDGIELLKIIREQYTQIKVIACTMHVQLWIIQKLLSNMVDGIISKNSMTLDVSLAIDGALTGKAFFSVDILAAVMEVQNKPGYQFSEFDDVVLSTREIEILKMISEELTTVEIADKLYISSNTVETHRKNLFLKFGVKNAAGLVKKAMERHLIK